VARYEPDAADASQLGAAPPRVAAASLAVPAPEVTAVVAAPEAAAGAIVAAPEAAAEAVVAGAADPHRGPGHAPHGGAEPAARRAWLVAAVGKGEALALNARRCARCQHL
jgi:hypothetical protein